MKSIIALLVAVVMVGSARADISMPKKDNMYDKLGRGAANVLLAPAELIDSPYSYLETEGGTVALTKGIAQGFGRMGSDFVLGLYDVFTFPIPYRLGGEKSYRSIKSPPWDSMVVNENPPADLKNFY